eukprot:TRINITY_DN62582_c0_g1_i1.p1 TRINITY_DN62582_c0_g1~~TRINITY_DN62582_c0_g1_i1.p1  ORF type:complete len:751 (+),score=140.41 TRINITY_DN62582_c0_g1_i1:69-2321(+)
MATACEVAEIGTSKGITLKVLRAGEVRRLKLTFLSFHSVTHAVRTLFPDEGFVDIKYYDNEGDLCLLTFETFPDFALLHAGKATVRLVVRCKRELPAAVVDASEDSAQVPATALLPISSLSPTGITSPSRDDSPPAEQQRGIGVAMATGLDLDDGVADIIGKLLRSTSAALPDMFVEACPIITKQLPIVRELVMRAAKTYPEEATEVLQCMQLSLDGFPQMQETLESVDLLLQGDGNDDIGDVVEMLLRKLAQLPSGQQREIVSVAFQEIAPKLAHILPSNNGPSWSMHRGILCNGCNAEPILGPPDRCTVGDDYDSCDACYSRGGDEYRDQNLNCKKSPAARHDRHWSRHVRYCDHGKHRSMDPSWGHHCLKGGWRNHQGFHQDPGIKGPSCFVHEGNRANASCPLISGDGAACRVDMSVSGETGGEGDVRVERKGRCPWSMFAHQGFDKGCGKSHCSGFWRGNGKGMGKGAGFGLDRKRAEGSDGCNEEVTRDNANTAADTLTSDVAAKPAAAVGSRSCGSNGSDFLNSSATSQSSGTGWLLFGSDDEVVALSNGVECGTFNREVTSHEMKNDFQIAKEELKAAKHSWTQAKRRYKDAVKTIKQAAKRTEERRHTENNGKKWQCLPSREEPLAVLGDEAGLQMYAGQAMDDTTTASVVATAAVPVDSAGLVGFGETGDVEAAPATLEGHVPVAGWGAVPPASGQDTALNVNDPFQTLQAMGFDNRELIEDLLSQHHGSLEAVIEDLLS